MEISGIIIEISDQNFPNWIELFNKLLELYQNHVYDQENIYYQKDGITIRFNKLKLRIWIEEFKKIIESYKKYGSVDFPIYYELDEITIETDSKKLKKWLNNFKILLDYYKQYGNIDVPISFQFHGVKIGRWLDRQKTANKGINNSKLSKTQEALLNIFKMKWNKREENWKEKYRLAREFYEEFGNIDVPSSYVVDSVHLRSWLDAQREAYDKKELPEYKIKLLDDLKMKWNVKEDKWYHNYNLLKQYYEKHKNINVPIYYEVDGIQLGLWLDNQRKAYHGKKSLKITQEHIRLLNCLDNDWNPTDTRFLNYSITIKNQERYEEILRKRLNHILDDLIYEDMSDFSDYESQQEIKKIIVKRLWR